MPMYIDRHDAPGVSPQALADAHTADVGVEQRHGVKYHTYWFDEDNGSIFCLAEGPNKDAVEAVHRESHGLLASTILELDPNAPLNSFFGSIPRHPVGTPYTAPAMRAILFTDVCGSVAQTHQLGDDGHMLLLREHNEIVRSELVAHDGREVKHTGDGIMASFTSIVEAVDFAVAVQRRIDGRNENADRPVPPEHRHQCRRTGHRRPRRSVRRRGATRGPALRGRRARRHRRVGGRARALRRQDVPLRRSRPA